MCGRYATTRTAASLVDAFDAELGDVFVEIEPDFNVAPTKPAPVVIGRVNNDEVVRRELITAQWGLVPSWAKDASVGSRMINARSETVADKPAFRRAFARRRALIPADGYYEWYATEQLLPSGKPKKQPFYITPKDREVMAMAGIFEFWRASADDDWLITFAVLTTAAEDELGHLHDRMPLIVEPDGFDDWLNPAAQRATDLLDLLVLAAPGRLDAFPVSTAVGNVRNNGPELIAPLPAE